MTSKEDLLKQLQSITVSLYQDYKVPHKVITQTVHNALKELSDKLPKIPVLYNGVHGGFGLDKQFLKYLALLGKGPKNFDATFEKWLSCDISKDERIKYVDKIKEYGDYCMKKYPFVTKLIAIYNKYKIDDVFNKLHSIEYLTQCIDEMQNTILVKINNTNDNLFGKEEVTNKDFLCKNKEFFDINKVLKYTKASLIDYYQASIDEDLNKIHKHETALQTILGGSTELYTFICQNYKATCDDNNTQGDYFSSLKKKRYDEKHIPGKGLQRFTFMDAIEEYGETHHGIWECQSHYSKKPLNLLCTLEKRNQKLAEYFTITDDEITNTFDASSDDDEDNTLLLKECIGLLFASGPYCKLCIGYAPQILSWHIGEYDGLESICY